MYDNIATSVESVFPAANAKQQTAMDGALNMADDHEGSLRRLSVQVEGIVMRVCGDVPPPDPSTAAIGGPQAHKSYLQRLSDQHRARNDLLDRLYALVHILETAI